MVSALDSGSSGPGSSPDKTLYTHSVSLHPGEYKWVPANLLSRGE